MGRQQRLEKVEIVSATIFSYGSLSRKCENKPASIGGPALVPLGCAGHWLNGKPHAIVYRPLRFTVCIKGRLNSPEY